MYIFNMYILHIITILQKLAFLGISYTETKPTAYVYIKRQHYTFSAFFLPISFN